MRFARVFVFAFLATLFAVVAVVPLADACESDCRTGVSNDIADAYKPEDDPFWKKFQNDCLNNWYRDITVSRRLRSEASKRITSVVAAFHKELNDRFFRIIYDSLFKQEPKFMGDCSNPRRVIQPKTMPWPRDSCEKQDYICGNPPAICHFLNEIVKPRVFTNINTEFKTRDDAYLNRLQRAVDDSCKAVGLSTTERKAVVSKARDNLRKSVRQASRDFPRMFCSNGSCDEHDESLRLKILNWP